MLTKKLLVDYNIQLVTNKCVSLQFKGGTEKHCLLINFAFLETFAIIKFLFFR